MGRTDNDSWDLATSVGATATMVAAGTSPGHPGRADRRPVRRAAGARRRRRLLHPVGRRRTRRRRGRRPRRPVGHAAHDRHAGRTHPLHRRVLLRGRRRRHPPGGDLGFRARRPRLPAALGAGDDGVRDRPAASHRIQDQHTIDALGAKPTADVRAVAIDLRDDWPIGAASRPGFDTGRPAAWAAEGLLGFLPPDAQDRLLDNITELVADGSQLVAEVFLNSGISGDALNEATKKWQRQRARRRAGQSGLPGRPQRRGDLLGRPRLAAGAHPALISCWPTTDYRCSPVTRRRPVRQELLLHRGVAQGRRKAGS